MSSCPWVETNRNAVLDLAEDVPAGGPGPFESPCGAQVEGVPDGDTDRQRKHGGRDPVE